MARAFCIRVILASCLALVWCGEGVFAREPAPAYTGVEPAGVTRTLGRAELPPEAQATLKLIFRGGPFPHEKDGTVFGNRERQLPAQPRGFYHEYTVKTPGARDRGARRIVCGSPASSVCFYTDDHYASFRRIVD